MASTACLKICTEICLPPLPSNTAVSAPVYEAAVAVPLAVREYACAILNGDNASSPAVTEVAAAELSVKD